MNTKLFLLLVALPTFLAFTSVPALSQTVVTFDDIPTPNIFAPIPNGYQGLDWSTEFGVLNVFSFDGGLPLNGYYYGMVTASNVAYNGSGSPVEIDSLTNFNFVSAYFTGAWNSNLNIEVQGYSGANLLYDQTVIASATNATLFTFNYTDIDRLTFNSFGGQNAGFINSGGENFVMDNFTFEFIPEPSSLLLAAMGGMSLVVFLRRRKT